MGGEVGAAEAGRRHGEPAAAAAVGRRVGWRAAGPAAGCIAPLPQRPGNAGCRHGPGAGRGGRDRWPVGQPSGVAPRPGAGHQQSAAKWGGGLARGAGGATSGGGRPGPGRPANGELWEGRHGAESCHRRGQRRGIAPRSAAGVGHRALLTQTGGQPSTARCCAADWQTARFNRSACRHDTAPGRPFVRGKAAEAGAGQLQAPAWPALAPAATACWWAV